jgi:UDP-2,3-diacylglucosamine pyrophosphatase LpxH
LSDMLAPPPVVHFHHSLFLSDLHLGARGSRADLVLKFLQRNMAQTYVLVGDFLDIGHPLLPHWTTANQAVVDHLKDQQAAGATLIYVRGNHDPHPDTAPAEKRLPVSAVEQTVHHGPDGRRFLVVHGDAQDRQMFQSTLLTRLGTLAEEGVRAIDYLIGRFIYHPGPDRRSVIEHLLTWVNWALHPGNAHEDRLIALAREGGYDGVICGHFHRADLHDRHGLIYANCGDWMDSFTALAADHTGRLQLLGGRDAFASTATAGQPDMAFS